MPMIFFITSDGAIAMMDGIPYLGKMLVILGTIIIVFGIIFIFVDKIPFLGKLPGDIILRKKNLVLYFPIVTCLLISLILTLILYLFRK